MDYQFAQPTQASVTVGYILIIQVIDSIHRRVMKQHY